MDADKNRSEMIVVEENKVRTTWDSVAGVGLGMNGETRWIQPSEMCGRFCSGVLQKSAGLL